MIIQDFILIWNRGHEDVSFWTAVLLSVVMVFLNLLISFMIWYLIKGSIREFGYPKSDRKTIKKRIAKRFKSYSIWNKITLFQFSREVQRRGLYIALCVMCNMFNCLCAFSCIIGAIGTIATRADSWALALLICSGMLSFLVCAVLVAIPSIFFLPSERRRYKL